MARHLVEDCGAEGATLHPDPEIVTARRQAEEQLLLQQQQTAAMLYTTGGGLSLIEDNAQMANTQLYLSEPLPEGTANEGLVAQYASANGIPMVLNTEDGQLPEGATIDFTTPGGDVIQRLVLPEDLHLEAGQTLVLIQGEDGQPQFAIVNQAEWEANNQQLMLQQEEETNQLLLYGNMEQQPRAVSEEEKENQFAA
ncbi:unnamed protein product [Dibothriocephalus latus]|uniref:Uncharacterized protein n=1 Tax=Dibothriocephalus latus TaxID=60516 RepID=A0A3P7LFC6_DIBLA|nr:unnamed protein product [Dibothriocephalus latus]